MVKNGLAVVERVGDDEETEDSNGRSKWKYRLDLSVMEDSGCAARWQIGVCELK